MSRRSQIAFFVSVALVLALGTWNGRAFSLLGPFEPWMQQTNDLRQQGDIGGPMCISNAYRWNVPVVTYGFDPSFINFFGTNGVAAVENAIQIINNLPAASDITATNYPLNTTRGNAVAGGQYLFDLKSVTLSLLLEQMGLAQPTRYIYVLKQWNPVFSPSPSWSTDWPDWVFPDYISERNFDPQTLEPTNDVNDQLYAAYIQTSGDVNGMLQLPLEGDFPQFDAPCAAA